MMFALSLLDLPFEAAEHKTKIAKNAQLTMTAGSPMIVFHEEIRQAGDVVEQTPILVSQNFFRHGDRYRLVNNERLDKFVSDEFLVHTVYGCQVVITNPTSSPQKLDVLVANPGRCDPRVERPRDAQRAPEPTALQHADSRVSLLLPRGRRVSALSGSRGEERDGCWRMPSRCR